MSPTAFKSLPSKRKYPRPYPFVEKSWIPRKKFKQSVLLPPASEGWRKVIFSVCSHQRGGGGGTPIQSMGVPPSFSMGGYHNLSDGIPPSSQWRGYPHLADRWGTPGYALVGTGWGSTPPPPIQDLMEVPPHRGLDGGIVRLSETEQHSEHLLRGGRYTSCVHTEDFLVLILLLPQFFKNSLWSSSGGPTL